MQKKVSNTGFGSVCVFVIILIAGTPARLFSQPWAGAIVCQEGGNYSVSAGGGLVTASQNCGVSCGTQVTLGSNFIAGVDYDVVYTIQSPGKYFAATALEFQHIPCGYKVYVNGSQTGGLVCDSVSGVTHTMTLSLEPDIAFGWDRCKTGGRYTLPADGQSRAMAYI